MIDTLMYSLDVTVGINQGGQTTNLGDVELQGGGGDAAAAGKRGARHEFTDKPGRCGVKAGEGRGGGVQSKRARLVSGRGELLPAGMGYRLPNGAVQWRGGASSWRRRWDSKEREEGVGGGFP